MKVLQWNIWYKEDIKNILKVIKKVNPDIVCLQEITVNHAHYNKNIHTAKFLAKELKFHYFYAEAQASFIDGKMRSYGDAILSRYPLTKKRFSYIQQPRNPKEINDDYSKEGRVYLEAKIMVNKENIVIATTHMSYIHKFKETSLKKKEARMLFKEIKNKKTNYILTGDFNALPTSYTIQGVRKYLRNCGPALKEKTWTTKVFKYKGYWTKKLKHRLDYCFSTKDMLVTSAKIVKTKYSDHLPLLIEFKQ